MKPSAVMNNRELSWLSFNERILQEARDHSTPLMQRLRFLGIFSSNQDEFIKVRVASLVRLTRSKSKIKPLSIRKPAYLFPQHPGTFHTYNICDLFILKDLFLTVKFSGNILGILWELQLITTSLLREPVIVNRNVFSIFLHMDIAQYSSRIDCII